MSTKHRNGTTGFHHSLKNNITGDIKEMHANLAGAKNTENMPADVCVHPLLFSQFEQLLGYRAND